MADRAEPEQRGGRHLAILATGMAARDGLPDGRCRNVEIDFAETGEGVVATVRPIGAESPASVCRTMAALLEAVWFAAKVAPIAIMLAAAAL